MSPNWFLGNWTLEPRLNGVLLQDRFDSLCGEPQSAGIDIWCKVQTSWIRDVRP
jgi:hypothetical protein